MVHVRNSDNTHKVFKDGHFRIRCKGQIYAGGRKIEKFKKLRQVMYEIQRAFIRF